MIIGVSGVARSGKDTFFNLLKTNLKGKKYGVCKRFAFADEIKKELNKITIPNFGIDCTKVPNKDKEKVRPLMVAYGTHLARSINSNHWINRIKPHVESHYKSGGICVITDVRYPNEQEFIKDNFEHSFNVHIHRFGFDPINKEEESNAPLLQQKSDYQISWKTFNNVNEGDALVQGFINEKLRRRE